MSLFNSLVNQKFRQAFMSFFVLSSLLPVLVLLYILYHYFYPIITYEQFQEVKDPAIYGLLTILFIQLSSFLLFFKFVKSFEKTMDHIILQSSELIDESPDLLAENELSNLRTLFDNLSRELKSKISELDEYSTRLIESNLKLSKMAMKDKLTTLFNRRYFDVRIAEEINRAERYGHQLCLIMLDIDDFKAYNDTNGHLAGDKLLTELAMLIKNSVRKSDIPFRYGGDELGIILPEIEMSGAQTIAKKLADLTAGHSFDNIENHPGGKLTLSIGISSFEKSGENIVQDADQTLYYSKNAGKGVVTTT